MAARDARIAVLGLAIVLVLSPLLADPDRRRWDLRRGSSARSWRATSWGSSAATAGGGSAATGGSRIGWPAELLVAAGARRRIRGHGLGAPADGPAIGSAAGFAMAALAVVPLLTGQDVMRIGIGALLLVASGLVVRSALGGTPGDFEQLMPRGCWSPPSSPRSRPGPRQRGLRRRADGPTARGLARGPLGQRTRAPGARRPSHRRPLTARPDEPRRSAATGVGAIWPSCCAGRARCRPASASSRSSARRGGAAIDRATVAFAGRRLATTEYLRLFLVLSSRVGLVLAIIGAATGGHRDAPAVTLGILATSALALALPDPGAAVLAATAGGRSGRCWRCPPVADESGRRPASRALRATIVAGTMAIAATAWIGRDLSELAAQPIVFGLAYLAFALGVAIRFGAIPMHTWAARLADAVPETSLPLVTAVAPAALAIVALAWADASIAPLLVDLGSVRAVVVAVAIASIVLATFAAWIQDDIEHIVGYAIVGDAGIVLLAIAALDPDAWAPARIWILALIVARSAFAAWAAVTRATFGTGRVGDLRGWIFRSPALGAILARRRGQHRAARPGRGGGPCVSAPRARRTARDPLATLGPLLYYGRLLAVGLDPRRPATRSTRGGPGRCAADLTDRAAGRDLEPNRAFTRPRWRPPTSLALLTAIGALAAAAAAAGHPRSRWSGRCGLSGPSGPLPAPRSGRARGNGPVASGQPDEAAGRRAGRRGPA